MLTIRYYRLMVFLTRKRLEECKASNQTLLQWQRELTLTILWTHIRWTHSRWHCSITTLPTRTTSLRTKRCKATSGLARTLQAAICVALTTNWGSKAILLLESSRPKLRGSMQILKRRLEWQEALTADHLATNHPLHHQILRRQDLSEITSHWKGHRLIWGRATIE